MGSSVPLYAGSLSELSVTGARAPGAFLRHGATIPRIVGFLTASMLALVVGYILDKGTTALILASLGSLCICVSLYWILCLKYSSVVLPRLVIGVAAFQLT